MLDTSGDTRRWLHLLGQRLIILFDAGLTLNITIGVGEPMSCDKMSEYTNETAGSWKN